jgi:adenylylsulfate kinase
MRLPVLDRCLFLTMMLIQLTGLSGAGKTTIAKATQALLQAQGHTVEIVDGDTYRQTLCSDLGFSAADRQENIRRLGNVAHEFTQQGKLAIIAAINPFEAVRQELLTQYGGHVVWIRCGLNTLVERDTKGLYRKALLPEGHPEKLSNLTGVNDVYEVPANPGLIIETDQETAEASSEKLYRFIVAQLAAEKQG